jgi:acetylornithine deacetylase
MPPITELEARVLDAIDEVEIVHDLTELVAIPSVDGTPEEAAAQRWCGERLASIGLRLDVWDINIEAERQQIDFPGMEVERAQALGCVAILDDDGTTPALALYGHTDVVPPGDVEVWPGGDPFAVRIDEGVAWGRGTCDMKAGVVAAIAAVAALGRSGRKLARPLAVHCVSGEEDGGLGAFATLRRGHLADACVIAEPTAGSIIPANAGSLTFRLDVPGIAAHGSTRTRGVSAIEKFEVIHRALRVLETERNVDPPALFAHLDLAWPLSVGVVEAGDWASTVPDHLSAWGRYGVRMDETLAEAMAAFEETVAAACRRDPWLRDHPVRVTWPGGRFAPGQLPDGHELFHATSGAVNDVLGATPPSFGGPYGSDLRHYAGAGIATLQYGPGDVRYAHATDEHVRLDEVFACARVYALLAIRSCGVTADV